MTKLKICGLMKPEDVCYVNEAKPDYIGFILSPGFRRSISRELAAEMKKNLSEDILATGVFVDEEIPFILSFAEDGIIDQIQLHGIETDEYISELKKKTELPVIKAFKAGTVTEEELKTNPADMYIIDSGKGTGKTFDWSLVPRIDKPWLLAGGITAENAEDAIRRLKPTGLDLSSSVETDGYKDREKIIEITNIVRKEK